jgi:site-specific recombinase XerD
MVISLAGYSQDEIEDHVFLKDLLRFCERHPGNQLGVVKGLELLAASRVVACTKRIRECAAQGNVEGVFLETIYLAGLNIRSRRHSKIIIGENTLNLRSKGGKARSMKVSEEASKKHAQWKAEAKKILARKPKASKSQVALYVKSKLKLEQSIQTIRKNI